ncbi:MAG: sulfatase [Mariniphaga sp.]|nr:sulfatase [Mariniphaga sp.]
MKKIIFLIIVLILFFGINSKSQNSNRTNVLFIAVDDLRPELGIYGASHIKSPNIDRLAESGIVFNRAYCNIPVCGASRASILSGIRPNRQRFLNYHCWQDKDVPGVVSLPMHFKNNGYSTVSLGKIYHHIKDGQGSWERAWHPKAKNNSGWRDYRNAENLVIEEGGTTRGYPYENADVPDNAYFDGRIADEAIKQLADSKNSGEPFFLAVGFLKPHLPFNAPQKYWDMYDPESIELPDFMGKPDGAPDECMHTFGELRAYKSIPEEGEVPESIAKKLIHGYYACVSYTDAQIGRVLNQLEEMGLAENTIVILWGDHGWHLGEHGLWCKHCNFEKVLHTPLILRAPGKKSNQKTEALVEYVDVYPTLCELAGLPLPFHLQGNSMAPLLDDPLQPWKDAVFARWIRGETVITKEHTYTEWFNDNSGDLVSKMLYNLKVDPEETVNISDSPENKSLVQSLHEKLAKHIKERDVVQLK